MLEEITFVVIEHGHAHISLQSRVWTLLNCWRLRHAPSEILKSAPIVTVLRWKLRNFICDIKSSTTSCHNFSPNLNMGLCDWSKDCGCGFNYSLQESTCCTWKQTFIKSQMAKNSWIELKQMFCRKLWNFNHRFVDKIIAEIWLSFQSVDAGRNPVAWLIPQLEGFQEVNVLSVSQELWQVCVKIKVIQSRLAWDRI